MQIGTLFLGRKLQYFGKPNSRLEAMASGLKHLAVPMTVNPVFMVNTIRHQFWVCAAPDNGAARQSTQILDPRIRVFLGQQGSSV